jgi:xylan 1,4-beta-xylosidase
LSDVHVEGERSDPVEAASISGPASGVTVEIDAGEELGALPRPWRPMIGSEHLSHRLSTDTTGGRVVGEELTTALRAAHDELGVSHVRAHAILGDDLGLYREVDGEQVHDFTGVDRVYDHLRSIGMYPVVELSFMPHDLASDPSKTVFEYGAIVSPPKDWQRWHDLIRDLVVHLADRYGLEDLVEHWSFEVWNEANLEVFWSGTPEEYLQLYDVTATAVRTVDPRLRVGGPSSAASGWVEELLAHAERSGSPVDFVTTHTYGSPPLDFQPMLERYGREGTPIWWTEWGVTPTHFNEVSDAVFAGTFLLRGMASAMGPGSEPRIESLSYWVVSDHFEELGRPPALLHGGFGTRTVGELRKPRWWALALLERLPETRLGVSLTGDGAGSLVEALSSRSSSGEIGVLVWNLTLDQTKASGSADLARPVTVAITGLEAGASYVVHHDRVDDDHSDIAAVWGRLKDDGQDWPTDEQWAQLRAADKLEALVPDDTLVADDKGRLGVSFDLPMPSMSSLTLTPVPGNTRLGRSTP